MDILFLFYSLIQIIFFLVVVIDFIFLILPHPFKKNVNVSIENYPILSILVPARNEERYIERSLHSIVNAKWPGKKEIIVVDDASEDRTLEIVSKFKDVRVLRNRKHMGKAFSLNKALKHSKGEVIVTIDADTIIPSDSLIKAYSYLCSNKKIGAVSLVNKVENKNKGLGLWINLLVITYSGLINYIRSKLNLAIVVSGPFTMFRRESLESVGGFSRKGYAEDIDVAIKLVRKGWSIIYLDRPVVRTFWPVSLLGFIKQRIRFAKGGIHALKLNFLSLFKFKNKKLRLYFIDVFSLPLFFIYYFQSLVIVIFIMREVIRGYVTYFLSQGVVFNFYVMKFFLGWFSAYSFFEWSIRFFQGKVAFDTISLLSIIATYLTYFFYIYSLWKFDSLLDLKNLIALFFIPLFWFIISVIYAFSIIEYFLEIPYNKWEKLH